MTEAEWLECDNPWPLLAHVRRLWHPSRRVSDRQLLLFTVGCARFWGLSGSLGRYDPSALDAAERYADGLAKKKDVPSAWKNPIVPLNAVISHASGASWTAVRGMPLGPERDAAHMRAEAEVHKKLSDFIRAFFGNPFRPVCADPAWLTPTVVSLAATSYDERQLPSGQLQPKRLAMVADALAEAGCTDPVILSHLLGSGPHLRGFWVVDLILGKR